MNRNPARDLLLLCAILWAPVALAAPASPPAGSPGPPPVPEATVVVDCDAGEKLADALATRADVLTVELTGTCAEELVITRDRLTIRGLDPSATVTDDPSTSGRRPIFLLQGADVVLEGFTVDGSSDRGLRVQRSSGIQMQNMTVTNSANSGLTIEESSSVHVVDSIFTNNGFAGITAFDNSSVALSGTLDVSANAIAGLLVTGSTVNNRGGQVIVADDQFFGVGTQHGGSGLFPPVQARNTGTGAFTFGGRYLGSVTVEESNIGVLVSNRGSFDGPVNLSVAVEGLRIIDNSNVFLRGGPISAPLAINLSTNGTLETTGVSFDGDLRFAFGSRAFFASSSATGALICHPTALVGGSLSCPSPLADATQSFDGSAAAPVALPYPLPLVEPD